MFNFYTLPLCNPIIVLIVALQIEIIVTQAWLLNALFCLQAYTSQFVSLVMFGLMMSEDRISLQKRRREIISGLKSLPGILIFILGLRRFCLMDNTEM